jgi:hypothetical protein
MTEKFDAEVSSGNVFADLGLRNPEELRAKSKLAISSLDASFRGESGVKMPSCGEIGRFDDESKASDHLLKRGFRITRGVICGPDAKEWTQDDHNAVDYLCGEWDYAMCSACDPSR